MNNSLNYLNNVKYKNLSPLPACNSKSMCTPSNSFSQIMSQIQHILCVMWTHYTFCVHITHFVCNVLTTSWIYIVYIFGPSRFPSCFKWLQLENKILPLLFSKLLFKNMLVKAQECPAAYGVWYIWRVLFCFVSELYLTGNPITDRYTNSVSPYGRFHAME